MLIQLKPSHRPTAIYQDRIRQVLAAQFPNVTSYFQAADITSQVLNSVYPLQLMYRSPATICNRVTVSRCSLNSA